MVSINTFGGAFKGGGERYVVELSNALGNAGWTVGVASIGGYTNSKILVEVDGHSQLGLRSLARAFRSHSLVHVHQLNSPGFDLALLAKAIWRHPIVLTDHGGGLPAAGRAFGKSRLRYVDAAALVSPFSANDIDPNSQLRRRNIIWGGGDHLPKTLQKLDRSYTFGYVGRLLPHKGVHIALAALPPGASMVIAGQVRDQTYFEKLQQLSRGLDVDFILDPDDEAISRLYNSVDCLLSPSVSEYENQLYARPELLGIAALEALAAGTPVIGSDVGGLAELLQSAGQRVVEAGNVAAWQKALSESITLDASNIDGSQYTWQRVAESVVESYNAVLADSPPKQFPRDSRGLGNPHDAKH